MKVLLFQTHPHLSFQQSNLFFYLSRCRSPLFLHTFLLPILKENNLFYLSRCQSPLFLSTFLLPILKRKQSFLSQPLPISCSAKGCAAPLLPDSSLGITRWEKSSPSCMFYKITENYEVEKNTLMLHPVVSIKPFLQIRSRRTSSKGLCGSFLLW